MDSLNSDLNFLLVFTSHCYLIRGHLFIGVQSHVHLENVTCIGFSTAGSLMLTISIDPAMHVMWSPVPTDKTVYMKTFFRLSPRKLGWGGRKSRMPYSNLSSGVLLPIPKAWDLSFWPTRGRKRKESTTIYRTNIRFVYRLFSIHGIQQPLALR